MSLSTLINEHIGSGETEPFGAAHSGNATGIHSDVTGQKQIEADSSKRRNLQRLIAELPSRFIAMKPENIDPTIAETLRMIVETLEIGFSLLVQKEDRNGTTALTHFWPRNRDTTLSWDSLREEDLPWCHYKVLRGDVLSFSSTIDFCPAESTERSSSQNPRVASGVSIPFMVNGYICGAIAFGVWEKEREWREDDIVELQICAQLIGNLVGRQRTERREDQLRAELAHALRVATLGELTATLAHELNQPLAAILSNAQAARRFIANDAITREELRTIFDDIVRDGKRAGGILHHVRAMVSKARVHRELCCVNELVAEVAELMEAELLREQIKLRVNLLPGIPQVEGARVELQQVMMNLLINAAQAMKDVPFERRALEIETTVGSTMVIVHIRDRGHGIPGHRMSEIFDPFFTTKPTGLGMGLSICRRILENHGGEIKGENEEIGGARFTVSLPVANRTGRADTLVQNPEDEPV